MIRVARHPLAGTTPEGRFGKTVTTAPCEVGPCQVAAALTTAEPREHLLAGTKTRDRTVDPRQIGNDDDRVRRS
jgi:hypothetical protein